MSSKPRRARTPITQQFKENIVRDHHDLHMTFLQLSYKYKCCFSVCKKICEQNEYGFWTKQPGLAEGIKHRPVTKNREKLTEDERKNKVSDDALEIIELAMQEMKELLIAKKCTPTQIKDFVNSVIPYIIKKPDNTQAKDGKGDRNIKDDAKKLHSMWKTE